MVTDSVAQEEQVKNANTFHPHKILTEILVFDIGLFEGNVH